jgi:hypothetical protein
LMNSRVGDELQQKTLPAGMGEGSWNWFAG